MSPTLTDVLLLLCCGVGIVFWKHPDHEMLFPARGLIVAPVGFWAVDVFKIIGKAKGWL